MTLEAVSATPPHAIPRSFTGQCWRDVVFLHWRAAPDAVRPLLPPGTEPDVHDGSTWVGVIGLRMTGLSLAGVPYPPFLELNVRLYCVDGDGRRGVVFRAMEATDPLFSAASRAALRLPYNWTAMRFSRHGDEVGYRTRRHWPGPARAGVRMKVRLGDPVEPGPLENFLTARWALHQAWYGPTLRVPVGHDPWPLYSAEPLDWIDDGLLRACGLPALAGPPESALYSPATTVRIGTPVPLQPK